jgi:hypothetical protein
VIVHQSESGEQLSAVRILNDPVALRRARAGRIPTWSSLTTGTHNLRICEVFDRRPILS